MQTRQHGKNDNSNSGRNGKRSKTKNIEAAMTMTTTVESSEERKSEECCADKRAKV